MTYSYTSLESLVKNLYHDLSIFVPEEIDMIKIANELKVKLHFYDDSSTAVEMDGIKRIFLDERLSPQEQWQDFAHEICHLLRHHGNQLYLSTGLSTLFLKLQEIQAENFMYQFCVPTFMLLESNITNYMNIHDGVKFVSSTFNVTEKFAKRRLIHFRNQMQQSKSDEEHRRQMEALYPKAPPYSEETNAILAQLKMIQKRKVS